MRPHRAMLLAVLALAGGLSACGSDDSLSTDIPRTSPDLTIPSATTDLPPADATSTSTSTSTTSTSTSTSPSSTFPPAATPPAAAEPPAAAAPPPAQAPATTTGGGSTGAGTTTGASRPSTGGADFQNFCRDNPGAGPPC